jgi:hypothetical protein
MSAQPADAALPPPPEAPEPASCCGNGCSPCVHDVYAEELADWEARCAALLAALAVPSTSSGG